MKNYRTAKAGEILCAECIHSRKHPLDKRMRCGCGGDRVPWYAVGRKCTCDNASRPNAAAHSRAAKGETP